MQAAGIAKLILKAFLYFSWICKRQKINAFPTEEKKLVQLKVHRDSKEFGPTQAASTGTIMQAMHHNFGLKRYILNASLCNKINKNFIL